VRKRIGEPHAALDCASDRRTANSGLQETKPDGQQMPVFVRQW